MHGIQKTKSTDLDLLAIVRYSHGVLQGKTAFYNTKTLVIGEWDYKKGKITKIKVQPQKIATEPNPKLN